MKIWMAPTLIMLYWLPWMTPEEAPWDGSAYDLYMFESADRVALAVVSPDPFAPTTGFRGWRAEVHVRTGEASVTDEIYFEADSIMPDTVVFVETAWGREVHVFPAAGTAAPESSARLRWRVEEGGLRALDLGGQVH